MILNLLLNLLGNIINIKLKPFSEALLHGCYSLPLFHLDSLGCTCLGRTLFWWRSIGSWQVGFETQLLVVLVEHHVHGSGLTGLDGSGFDGGQLVALGIVEGTSWLDVAETAEVLIIVHCSEPGSN